MFGSLLKATNSSFQKGMAFCRSIYVKKVMKLLAFIFEQPSYCPQKVGDIGMQRILEIKILIYGINNFVFGYSNMSASCPA